MIYLMDMGTHFDMAYKKQRVSIEYGEYSLSLANIDYDGFQKIIRSYVDRFTPQFEQAVTLSYLKPSHEDTFKKYEQRGIYPNGVSMDVIKKINATLHKPLMQFLDNGYLNKTQLRIISMLILEELENHIRSTKFNWQDEITYIPSILIYEELKEHLESILLRDSTYYIEEIQKRLSDNIIQSKINIDKNGIPRTTYIIQDTISYMMIDLQKYLTGTKTVLRCQNPDCNRLFYPKSKKNKLYCRLIHKDTDLLCHQIMHNKPRDEFAECAKSARGKQGGFVKNAIDHQDNEKYMYDYESLRKAHYAWQEECSEKLEYFRSQNDIDGFKKWIKDTELNVKRLEELNIRTVKKTSSSIKK